METICWNQQSLISQPETKEKPSEATRAAARRREEGRRTASSLSMAWVEHLREQKRWSRGIENAGFALLAASALAALAWLVLSSGQFISGWRYFVQLVSQLIA